MFWEVWNHLLASWQVVCARKLPVARAIGCFVVRVADGGVWRVLRVRAWRIPWAYFDRPQLAATFVAASHSMMVATS